MRMSTDPKDMLRAAAAAFEARDRDLTAERLRAIIDANPPLGATWAQVVRLAGIVGEGKLAAAAAERRAQGDPDNVVLQIEWGAAVARHGDDQRALEIARRVAATHPEMPAAHYLIGLCQAHLGEADAAVESMRRALAQRDDTGDAWIVLATMKKFTAADPDLARLRDLCARGGNGRPDSEAGMRLALGKMLEDVGDYGGAFDQISRGAAIFAAQAPYDSDGDDRFADELTKTYDKTFAKTLARSTTTSDRPIFIVGLPRSGTTLLQEILAAHSAVMDGGELNIASPAMLPLNGYTPREINAVMAGSWGARDPWTHFGTSYLKMLESKYGPGGRIVDKSLTHSPFVGLLNHMLPNASILWIRRDPGDVALSCLRTRFNEGIQWSWSQTAIGRRFRVEDRLHAHWSKVLGDTILTVPYEELVAKPDAWISRVLKHCRLSNEPGVKDFHLSKRPVRTASMAQVRAPVNASAVGGWKRYEKQMKPFWDAYRR